MSTRLIGTLLAGLLAAHGAVAATVTVTPPSYTIQPPKFTFTLPDTIGGATGASVSSAAVNSSGHLILTLSTGATIDAGALPTPAAPTVDLSSINSAISSLQSSVAGLQAQVSALGTATVTTGTGTTSASSGVTPTVNPCSNAANANWTVLNADPTMNLQQAMACAATSGTVTLNLAAGHYAQVFYTPGGAAVFVIKGAGVDSTEMDGGGGLTVSANNAAGPGSPYPRLAQGKGVILLQNSATISNLRVTGGGSNSGGGDGQSNIYLQASGINVTLDHLLIDHSENGVFAGNGLSNVNLLISYCDFWQNGLSPAGNSHDTYMGDDTTKSNVLVIDHSNAYGALHGNVFKARFHQITVSNSFVRSSDPADSSQGGRWVDAANGATIALTNDVLVGNTCCTNHLGNGEENTNNGAGLPVTITGGTMFIATPSDFQSSGAVTGSGVTQKWGTSGRGNGSIGNSGGGAISGLATSGGSSDTAPATPASASGTKAITGE